MVHVIVINIILLLKPVLNSPVGNTLEQRPWFLFIWLFLCLCKYITGKFMFHVNNKDIRKASMEVILASLLLTWNTVLFHEIGEILYSIFIILSTRFTPNGQQYWNFSKKIFIFFSDTTIFPRIICPFVTPQTFLKCFC